MSNVKSKNNNNKQKNEKVIEEEPEETPLEMQLRFDQELRWCINEIENMKCHTKIMNDAERTLKILKSNKSSVIKKRQTMSSYFGDYRNKMKQQLEMGNKMKVVFSDDNCDTKNGKFIKKKSNKEIEKFEDKEFRFDFN